MKVAMSEIGKGCRRSRFGEGVGMRAAMVPKARRLDEMGTKCTRTQEVQGHLKGKDKEELA